MLIGYDRRDGNGNPTRYDKGRYIWTAIDIAAVDSGFDQDKLYWWVEDYGPISDHRPTFTTRH